VTECLNACDSKPPGVGYHAPNCPNAKPAPPQDAEPVEWEAADKFAELRRDFPQPDSSDHTVSLAYLALRDRLAKVEVERDEWRTTATDHAKHIFRLVEEREKAQAALAAAEKRVEELTRDYVDSCACPQCPTEAEKRREKEKE